MPIHYLLSTYLLVWYYTLRIENQKRKVLVLKELTVQCDNKG